MPAVWVAAGSNDASTTGGHGSLQVRGGEETAQHGEALANSTAGGKREGSSCREKREETPALQSGGVGGRGERKVSHVSGPCVTHWSPPHREC